MNVHVASLNALQFPAADFAKAVERERATREMASHIVAAAAAGVCLTEDHAVIQYLFDCEDRYRWAAIRDRMDAAMQLARETITLAGMGLR